MTHEEAIGRLAGQIRGEVLFDDISRALYSTSACIYQLFPMAVVQPRDTRDVRRTVQICAQAGMPVTARGAGSGLVGQALGTGVILDFSRYMCRVCEIDTQAMRATVEPGAVLNNLQEMLKPDPAVNDHGENLPGGLFFPPDPSSGNYCTLGGMIGTNASGAHSLKYGATVDYVKTLDVILAGGEQVTFREYVIDSEEYRELEASNTLAGRLHKAVRSILARYADELKRYTPKTSKNSSGYRLDRIVRDGRINLARLMTGAEGTLGLVVGATLRLRRRPTAQRMLVLWFADLSAAATAVEHIIPLRPAALEILDAAGIRLILSKHPELERFLPAQAGYVLFVKFDGDDSSEVDEVARRMQSKIVDELQLAGGAVAPDTQSEQDELWAVRKALLPILYKLEGPGSVIGFIEDIVVPPDRIVDFVKGLSAILDKHSVKFVVYGHAGQGNFHVRPVLNLQNQDDVDRMRSIADATVDLAVSLDGTISGEHGDGLARTPYLRKLYGELYPAFEDIKKLFDPHNLFNPGRIVGGQPDSLTSNLRAGPDYSPASEQTELHFEPGARQEQLEACQGCGACRTILPVTTMCPVYKALRDERVAPRAKANLLMGIMTGRLDAEAAADVYKYVLSMCIGCGSCRIECPSNVDVPKLMLDAKAAWAKRHGRSLDEWLLAHAETLANVNQRLQAVANRLTKLKTVRAIMQAATGIDKRRTLPPVKPYAEARRIIAEKDIEPRATVVYFPDIYARFNDPSVGIAAIEVLEYNGIEVLQPPLKPAGVPALIYGDLSSARKSAEYNLDVLDEYLEAGHTVICTEPTATLALREHYPDLLPTSVAGRDGNALSAAARDIFDYLHEKMQAGELHTPEQDLPANAAYHTPCHLKALEVGRPAVDVLASVPGFDLTLVDEGCCGMAGTFGLRSKYYQLSMEIGRGLFERLRDGRFDFVLTDCSTCAMGIRDGAAITVFHPVKALWASYGLGELTA